ncbi:MAG: S8 family serine peptidase [Massilia sp.]
MLRSALCLGLFALPLFTLADDNPAYSFAPTKLRSEYLRLPVSGLAPMLDWLEGLALRQAETQPSMGRASATLIHSMLLRGRPADALAEIATARRAIDKPSQRAMLYLFEELLAQALVEGWDQPRFAMVAAQRVNDLPWPAARTRLKQLIPSLDIPPFEKTVADSVKGLDQIYQMLPVHSPLPFANNILETRFSGEILRPRADALRKAIKSVLDAKGRESTYWPQRAYPPLEGQGRAVRVAVWEPEGVDIDLFKHPPRACLVLASGGDCLIDPQIDGLDRTKAWALVQGYHDSFLPDKATPESLSWGAWQEQLHMSEFRLKEAHRERSTEYILRTQRLMLEVIGAGGRRHGTHVAGIVAEGNPFVELVAIRDAQTLALQPNPDAAEWNDRFDRIANFLKNNQVRVVNMSWGTNEHISPGNAASLEKHMLALMAALPTTLFVAGAGNDDQNIDKQRFLPGSLSAPNLLTVGAVDQDGQITNFTNTGPSVGLYANGDTVRSVAPGGYPLLMSGTSMAAPQVCNAAAKLLSQHPALSVAELKRLLIDGADELPAGDQIARPIRVLNPAQSARLSGPRSLSMTD